MQTDFVRVLIKSLSWSYFFVSLSVFVGRFSKSGLFGATCFVNSPTGLCFLRAGYAADSQATELAIAKHESIRSVD